MFFSCFQRNISSYCLSTLTIANILNYMTKHTFKPKSFLTFELEYYTATILKKSKHPSKRQVVKFENY